jgi:hypothetical protein
MRVNFVTCPDRKAEVDTGDRSNRQGCMQV